MYYVFSTQKPMNEQDKKEREYAISKDCFCFYDTEYDSFVDENYDPIQLYEAMVEPRISDEFFEDFQATLEFHKAIIKNTTSKGHLNIRNWYQFVGTRDNQVVLSGKDLVEDPNMMEWIIENSENGQIFFSTLEEDFAGNIDFQELYDKDSPLLKAILLHPERKFILRERKEILEDEVGVLSYHVIISDGKVEKIYRKATGEEVVDTQIVARAEEVVEDASCCEMPKKYGISIIKSWDQKENAVICEVERLQGPNEIPIYEANQPFARNKTCLYETLNQKIVPNPFGNKFNPNARVGSFSRALTRKLEEQHEKTPQLKKYLG